MKTKTKQAETESGQEQEDVTSTSACCLLNRCKFPHSLNDADFSFHMTCQELLLHYSGLISKTQGFTVMANCLSQAN